jgi:hypothetical protein
MSKESAVQNFNAFEAAVIKDNAKTSIKDTIISFFIIFSCVPFFLNYLKNICS